MAGPGGYRPGAGRPKWSKSKLDEKARAAAHASGITPLEFFLKIMRDEAIDDQIQPPYPLEMRLDGAKCAAPYMHSKLQAITVRGNNNGEPPTVRVVINGGLQAQPTVLDVPIGETDLG